MIGKPERIRLKVLVPVGITVMLILFSAIMSISWLQRLDDQEVAKKKIVSVQSHFRSQLSHESQLLGSLLEFVREDRKLAQLWQSRDREAILQYSLPIFERLKAWNRVTHLYFITPDKTCFLRVHKPESFGDKINRYTLNRAAQSGTLATGLELGRFGLLSIRMVQPWIIDGKLAGYLELAMEIDHILLQVAKESEVMLLFAIDKELVTRDRWIEGQQMVGHKPDWDRFDKITLSDTTDQTINQIPLDREISFKGSESAEPFQVTSGNRTFNCLLIPQKDVAGRNVGGFIVLDDITASLQKLHALIMRLTVFSVTVAGLLFLFFNTYLSKIQNGIISARNQLLGEIDRHETTSLALTKAKELAEAANRDLEAFSYSVTHDLRSPLTLINGYNSLILETYGTRLDEQGREYLQTVINRCERMDEFIDDMLTFSRASQEVVHREPVDLSEMAKLIMADLHLTAPERILELKIEEGIIVSGNTQLLRTVMENILGNAWKFTARKPVTEITLGTTLLNGTRVIFVRDNGAGFDMNAAAQLFVPFKRLHLGSEFAGSGIGLATVEKIVIRHGGRIWAEGASGGGATFYFTIPDGV